MKQVGTWLAVGLLCALCGFAGASAALAMAPDRLRGDQGERGPSGPAGSAASQAPDDVVVRLDADEARLERLEKAAATSGGVQDASAPSAAPSGDGDCHGLLTQVVTDVSGGTGG